MLVRKVAPTYVKADHPPDASRAVPLAVSPTFRLKLLGGALLEGPAGPLTGAATQRRPLAVLSLLAATAAGMSRDRVVAFLWPEIDDERARHTLAQLLYSLRQQLGSDAFTGTATALRLDTNVVSSDVHELETALGTGDLKRAVELYAGPFLDGFYLTGCDEFERWVAQERARIAQRVQSAVQTLASQATNAGDTTGAVRWNRRLAALAPFDSRIAIAVMTALARAGDRAGAVTHAREHESVVRRELDASPDPAVAALAASLATATALGDDVVVTDDSPSLAIFATAPIERAVADAAPRSLSNATPPARRSRYWLVPVPIVLVVLLLSIGALAVLLAARVVHPAPPDWLVVADVENATGDPIFDRTVSVALTAAVGQSPRIYVVPPERVRQTLVRMQRPGAESAFVERLAREVAQREGARAVLVPTIAKAGDSYEIVARLVDPASGGLLAVVDESALRRDAVLDALDRVGRGLRRKLGESMFSVASRTVPLPQVSTRSLDALQKYTQGSRAFDRNQMAVAETLWTQAVTIDTAFATAHAALGMFNFYTNRPAEGNRHFDHALAHVSRLPERDGVLIRAQAASWRGNRPASVAMLRAYLVQHPQDLTVLSRLGYDQLRLGQRAEAIETFGRMIALDSLDPIAFTNLATVERGLGRNAAAIAHYRRAFSLAPALETANNNVNLEYGTTFVRQGQLDSAALVFGKMLLREGETRARGLRSMAFLEMYRGRYTTAVQHLDTAMALNRASHAEVSELRNHLLQASALELLGRVREGAVQRDSAFALCARLDAESTLLFWTGKALARAGDVRRAAVVLGRLEKVIRAESATDRAAVEALRGELLVARGAFADAVPHLEAAVRADTTAVVLESAAHGAVSAGALDRAKALYEQLAAVDAFGWEGQEYSRTASYWMARIEDRRADVDHAAAAYRRFLEGWREAEPGFAPVVDARARLTRLRPGDVPK